MSIGVVILAAGASTRMGTPKQLLPYGETNLLCHTIDVALESVCRPVIVVLGAYFAQIKLTIEQLPVHIVENTDWQKGIGTSIRAGILALQQIEPNAQAVIITLCDQPFISVSTIAQLIDAYHLTHQPIVVSEYADTIGVPALFDRILFSELIALNASQGAKQVMQRHDRAVLKIRFAGGAIDLDTPEDYQRLISETG